ncbi:hypothetical protein [Mycolicibacterium vaccae]|uniref:hypothetical protein n=1 Tax=Mycolicibacterium vaccae TaxID=1810 RepID=UPI003D07F1D4
MNNSASAASLRGQGVLGTRAGAGGVDQLGSIQAAEVVELHHIIEHVFYYAVGHRQICTLFGCVGDGFRPPVDQFLPAEMKPLPGWFQRSDHHDLQDVETA